MGNVDMQRKYWASSCYQGAEGQKSSEPKTFATSQGLVCGGEGTPGGEKSKANFQNTGEGDLSNNALAQALG